MIEILVTLILEILLLLSPVADSAAFDGPPKFYSLRVRDFSDDLRTRGAQAGVRAEPTEGQDRALSVAAVIWIALLTYIAGSILYVYRFRGNTRHASFGQYLRKSWPIFAPLNCLLYLSTKAEARGAVLDSHQLPELALVKRHWKEIRDEAQALHVAGAIEASAAAGSPGYFDVGFRTFYKYGWRKFYLCWYGYTHTSAMQSCPRTLAVLSKIPTIRGAMFSFLPPGGALTQHSDPLACSLRYHLGLATPAQDGCFIEIDGVRRAWADGEDFLFDETYPHFARNDTQLPRLILMCDIERPMHLGGRLFNHLYRRLAALTVVPNTKDDRRGFASAAFARLAPWLQRSKALKASNRTLYRVLKTVVNSTLVAVVLGVLLGGAMLIQSIF